VDRAQGGKSDRDFVDMSLGGACVHGGVPGPHCARDCSPVRAAILLMITYYQ
jgi:hypothetical protein